MKKISIVLGLVLTLTIGTVVAYADNGISGMKFPGRYHSEYSVESMEELLKERAEFREERLNSALENGTITETEAKEWEEHFKYMDEFHEENGYLHGGRGCGGGHRNGGMGHGMMMRGNRF
ncbi:MAG: hypothetical protein GX053_07650 [Tissierella sp.]|nr:hypothetical protein [Tissierella sp.]